MACDLCGSLNSKPLWHIDGQWLVRCKDCSLVFLQRRPSQGALQALYSESYFQSSDPLKEGYEDYFSMRPGLIQVFKERLEMIEGYCPGKGHILDVGCAMGFFLEVARERGWQCQGVEFSPQMASHAQQSLSLPVHTGSLSQIPLPEESFDVVTMWDVLEHTLSPRQEVEKAHEIVKKGGFLFLTLPDQGSLISKLMGKHWFGYKKVREHFYYFSKHTIKRLLQEVGFEVIQVRPTCWPCMVKFLISKLHPYSSQLSKALSRVSQRLRLDQKFVKFYFIDMLVIARRPS